MATIFTQTPPQVNIHLLPSNAKFISYGLRDKEYLALRAWMPPNIATVEKTQSTSSLHNQFYGHFCSDCERNCGHFMEQFQDDDGDIDETHPELERHCYVYEEGYYGQYCPHGNELDEQSYDFDISSMVFEVRFPYLQGKDKFYVQETNAHLRDGRYDSEENQIYCTRGLQASNVHPSDFGNYLGEICWGNNSYPENLRECVFIFLDSEFNNDILPIHQFSENSNYLNKLIRAGALYCESNPHYLHHYLCQDKDALALIDAENDTQSFFTMLSAGYAPIPEAPHIMMLPLKEVQLESDGNVFFGFETEKDSVGLSWFISNQGLILGQIDNTFHRVGEAVASL